MLIPRPTLLLRPRAASLLAAIFLLVCNTLSAQKATAVPASLPAKSADARRPASAPRDTAIINLFEPTVSLQWVRYFKGRLDDVTSVELALGSDGATCRGYLTYTQSRLRLRLEGPIDATAAFRLQERDAKAGLTGHLAGQIANKRLWAEWASADQSLGGRLEAEEFVPTSPAAAAMPCADNKWANRYIGKYNGGRADLVLARVYNGELTGYLWLETDGRSYNVRGRTEADGNFALEALLPGAKTAAQIQGKFDGNNIAEATWMGSGELRQFDFKLRENQRLGCLEYADFGTSYDALYPRTGCDGCNRWLDDQLKRWADRCKSGFADKKITPAATNRAAQRASAWADIACWSETVFAGYLTFADTWSEHAQGQAFNFDLRTGKEITTNDLFNKNFDAKAWFAEYARKEMPKLPAFAADPKYREWITREGFPLFTIRRDGIELSTLFHPYYGRQVLLVPYQELKPFLKRPGPIAELLK